MSYKGRFKPKHYKKYKGDPTKVIYRSMWELRFMKYCDKTPNILEWSSEEVIIPYRGLDRKIHRYFPDFWIKYKNAKGQIVKEIIEVKPKAQTKKPTKKGKHYGKYLREARTYAINQAKWEAAEEYCLDRGYKFRIITEDHLKI
tara:strand:- start:590 stop:1021 length:432 start_codon:yes stop_codon:yes gene_type:complete